MVASNILRKPNLSLTITIFLSKTAKTLKTDILSHKSYKLENTKQTIESRKSHKSEKFIIGLLAGR